MPFQDRDDAGRQLAQRLTAYREDDPIVFGLPRGGVVVAYQVALALGAPLDVIVARKLGAPHQPELGIGAIAPGGVRLLDKYIVRALGITEERIAPIVEREMAEMERRLHQFREDRPPPDVQGRTVILVDDGLATGVTAKAALASLRQGNPRRIVLAVPVCAYESSIAFRDLVEELVCVEAPHDFRAVGYWYENFDQTTDEEVIELLRRANAETQTDGS